MRTYGGLLLFLRSGLLTAVMLALSAGAHLTGGGVLPDAGVLAGLTAVALVPVTAIALGRVRLRTAVLALGLGQIALHHAFTALAATAPCETGIANETMHGAHLGAAAPSATTGALHCLGAAPHLGPGLMDGNVVMTAAHVAAVMATAAVVAGGERSLVLLRAWLTPLLLLLVPVMPAAGERLRTRSDVACPVLPRRNGPTRSRRGPPLHGTATA